MESAQYLYMDIAPMNNFFNWTMTYRRDSDFYRPYGRVVKVKINEINVRILEGRENRVNNIFSITNNYKLTTGINIKFLPKLGLPSFYS